jgi:hypothetical protein
MKQGRIRGLALTAIVAPWLFTVTWLVAPLWQDHYRPIDQAVSELGAQTAGSAGVMNAAFVVWAAGILAGAAALHFVMPAGRWRAAAVSTLALAALTVIVIAFARLDCSATVSRACYDRLHQDDLSWQHYAHLWASTAFQVLFGLSALAIAGFLLRPLLAIGPALGGLIGLYYAVLSLVGDASFHPHAHYGLYQRVGLLLAAGWIELLGAAVLMRLDERRPASRPRPSAAPQRWSAGRPTRPSA